ncbi:MAG: transporter substrate-binding domain-containing protein [Pseudomonadota bacterium]
MSPFVRLACILLGLSAALPAQASELRMITLDAVPWATISPSGVPVGAFPDIVAEISRRTGVKASIAIQPFPRIERELETGEQDCTIVLWSDSRARIVERGEAVYMMTFGAIARAGVPLRSYEDLKSMTVSVVRNLAIEPRFDNDPSIRKDFDKDYETGIKKIAHNRLDAIAGAIPTIMYQAKKDGLTKYLGDQIVMTQIPLTLQCSKASRNLALMPRLDDAIRAMRADGTLARILSAYEYR